MCRPPISIQMRRCTEMAWGWIPLMCWKSHWWCQNAMVCNCVPTTTIITASSNRCAVCPNISASKGRADDRRRSARAPDGSDRAGNRLCAPGSSYEHDHATRAARHCAGLDSDSARIAFDGMACRAKNRGVAAVGAGMWRAAAALEIDGTPLQPDLLGRACWHRTAALLRFCAYLAPGLRCLVRLFRQNGARHADASHRALHASDHAGVGLVLRRHGLEFDAAVLFRFAEGLVFVRHFFYRTLDRRHVRCRIPGAPSLAAGSRTPADPGLRQTVLENTRARIAR